jgi:hypothetical protein
MTKLGHMQMQKHKAWQNEMQHAQLRQIFEAAEKKHAVLKDARSYEHTD